jgi:hypothetical protein
VAVPPFMEHKMKRSTGPERPWGQGSPLRSPRAGVNQPTGRMAAWTGTGLLVICSPLAMAPVKASERLLV